MKSRIQQLLFRDQSRLPLLSLVPVVGSENELPKLRAALLARLERVEESGADGGSGNLSVIVNETQSVERDEREMLKAALEWMALQEE